MTERNCETRGDKVFTSVNYIILSAFLIAVLYPLIYILSASFSNPTLVNEGKMWLYPVGFTLEGYRAVFEHKMIMSGYTNSMFYMGVGTLYNVLLTLLVAYPLSRKDLYGKGVVTFVLAFGMFFDGGLIPRYLLIKEIGLIYTRWAIIIPGGFAMWNMIITRTYFQTNLPNELLEAAQMDGCSDFRFFRSFALPLAKPIIAVITLFYAIGRWNSFFSAMIYLKDSKMFPLQLILRDILILNTATEGLDQSAMASREQMRDLMKYSLIVVANIPLLIMYPVIQKYFVKGIMVGSIKG